MPDETLEPTTAAFVAEVRRTYVAHAAPVARGALSELMSAGITPLAARSTVPTSPPTRRRFMFLDIVKTLPSKISAGALGAAIALSGLGAAGALPMSMVLTSNDTPAAETDGVATEEEAEVEEVEEAEVEEGDDVETDDGTAEGPAALGDVPVPTSVRDAAHTHDFDEACGNHGAYVSHFARFGEEPECATAARAAADGDDEADEAAADDDDDDDDDDAEKASSAKKGGAKSGNGAGKSGGKGRGGRR